MENEFRIERLNAPNSRLGDLYYSLIRLRWRRLLILALFVYLGVNVVFGSAYYLLSDGLRPQGMSFLECFFFSVHTFSTVGYGSISPESVPVHLVTVLETFTGLTSVAMTTGLFFAKFSRPSSRFLFSDSLLVTQNFGRKSLVFRVANARSNRVMDAQISMALLYTERSPEGISYRRILDLPLVRPQTPVFALSLTGVHPIEADGPVEGYLEKLRGGENIEILVSIKGLDDTFGQTIHATKSYRGRDIRWGGQFRDILRLREDGSRVIDFQHFNQVEG